MKPRRAGGGPVVYLGDGGAGKSFALRRLAEQVRTRSTILWVRTSLGGDATFQLSQGSEHWLAPDLGEGLAGLSADDSVFIDGAHRLNGNEWSILETMWGRGDGPTELVATAAAGPLRVGLGLPEWFAMSAERRELAPWSPEEFSKFCQVEVDQHLSDDRAAAIVDRSGGLPRWLVMASASIAANQLSEDCSVPPLVVSYLHDQLAELDQALQRNSRARGLPLGVTADGVLAAWSVLCTTHAAVTDPLVAVSLGLDQADAVGLAGLFHALGWVDATSRPIPWIAAAASTLIGGSQHSGPHHADQQLALAVLQAEAEEWLGCRATTLALLSAESIPNTAAASGGAMRSGMASQGVPARLLYALAELELGALPSVPIRFGSDPLLGAFVLLWNSHRLPGAPQDADQTSRSHPANQGDEPGVSGELSALLAWLWEVRDLVAAAQGGDAQRCAYVLRRVSRLAPRAPAGAFGVPTVARLVSLAVSAVDRLVWSVRSTLPGLAGLSNSALAQPFGSDSEDSVASPLDRVDGGVVKAFWDTVTVPGQRTFSTLQQRNDQFGCRAALWVEGADLVRATRVSDVSSMSGRGVAWLYGLLGVESTLDELAMLMEAVVLAARLERQDLAEAVLERARALSPLGSLWTSRLAWVVLRSDMIIGAGGLAPDDGPGSLRSVTGGVDRDLWSDACIALAAAVQDPEAPQSPATSAQGGPSRDGAGQQPVQLAREIPGESSITALAERMLSAGWADDARWLLGTAALAHSDPDEAGKLLMQARDVIDRSVTGIGALSAREAEVGSLVALGHTHREIGALLFISPKTVEHHVAAIRRKLGVTRRVELLAALAALRSG